MYQTDYSGIIGGLLAFVAVIWLICIACAVLQIIGMWKTFKKAGLNGWAAIIPFYNIYTLCKMAWGNGWLFFLFLIPLGGIVFMIATYIRVAKVFGKSGGFAVGLIFLAPIFWMILGLGNGEYLGYQIPGGGKKGSIIASAILGGVWLLFFIITMFVVGVTVSQNPRTQIINDYDEYDINTWESDDDLEFDGGGTEVIEGDNEYGEAEVEEELDLSQYGSDVIAATLTNGYVTIQSPIWDGEYTYADGGSYASAEKSGVSVDLFLGYNGLSNTSLEDEVSHEIEILESVYNDSSEYISDVTTDPMITGDGWALQQINYTYDLLDERYPCFDIVKVDECNGYPLVITISVNNGMADENTQDVFEEACEMYGVDFEFN